jgi:hypothetical protein
MEHEEMRSRAVADCGEALKVQALKEFLGRATSTDLFVKNWMAENHARVRTPRPEIEEAVRLYLGDDGWSPYRRSDRPAVRSVEFGSPIK